MKCSKPCFELAPQVFNAPGLLYFMVVLFVFGFGGWNTIIHNLDKAIEAGIFHPPNHDKPNQDKEHSHADANRAPRFPVLLGAR